MVVSKLCWQCGGVVVAYLHGGHVLKNVLEVLLAGKSGEFAGDDVLPLTGNHLGGAAGIHSLKVGLVGLDEEGVIVLRVGHDCGWCEASRIRDETGKLGKVESIKRQLWVEQASCAGQGMAGRFSRNLGVGGY